MVTVQFPQCRALSISSVLSVLKIKVGLKILVIFSVCHLVEVIASFPVESYKSERMWRN